MTTKRTTANKAGPHASVAFASRVANYHTTESNNKNAPPSRSSINARSAFRWGCAAKLFEWLDVQERQLYKSQIDSLDIKQFMMLDVGVAQKKELTTAEQTEDAISTTA